MTGLRVTEGLRPKCCYSQSNVDIDTLRTVSIYYTRFVFSFDQVTCLILEEISTLFIIYLQFDSTKQRRSLAAAPSWPA